jgi:pyruvate kinase
MEDSGTNPQTLCTIGPASMNDHVISRLEDLGVSLFRINLSHTKIEDLEKTIAFIQARTKVPVCLDSEGAQVRNGRLRDGHAIVSEHSSVEVVSNPIEGTERQFSLYPEYIVDELVVGDFISVDFNAVLFQVVDTSPGTASLRVLNGGRMGQNKAVTIERRIEMPPLTDKDKLAINIGLRMGIWNFALSFANFGSDVDEIRRLCGKDAFIISKIECRNGVQNLAQIAEKSNAILIDRGDLSREFPIERIPSLQRRIIDQCKVADRPVYVATNLLESMTEDPAPTRAEVNDIIMTLASGADGLVLAAETAIGKWPVACANMLVKLIRSHNSDRDAETGGYRDDPMSLLIEPHGGSLIHREGTPDGIEDCRRLEVEITDVMDCEQIAFGTYSPLKGFMTHDELDSVLEENKLLDGTTWTMPILLQVKEARSNLPKAGERIAIVYEDGEIYAAMDVSGSYTIDLDQVSKKWFGTSSLDHPGVERFRRRGPNCVSGEVTLVKKFPSRFRHFQLIPAQTRLLFSHKGWTRVVAFHTRNPAHRIHEFIQTTALESTHSDGLYISPVIGPKKSGDFLPRYVLESYQILIAIGVYPRNKVALGSFATYSRFCGPREAVFTALARKNMGCSHLIIGRDHAGVGDFYGPDDNRRLFEELGDIGVTPVFFNDIGYDAKQEKYSEVGADDGAIKISGTEVRRNLVESRQLPDWFMRKEIQEMLHKAVSDREPIFHE